MSKAEIQKLLTFTDNETNIDRKEIKTGNDVYLEANIGEKN